VGEKRRYRARTRALMYCAVEGMEEGERQSGRREGGRMDGWMEGGRESGRYGDVAFPAPGDLNSINPVVDF
jgi:hypothetical protein